MSVPKLSEEEIQRHLANLSGWSLAGDEITRQFEFKDFSTAMQFVNHVAQEAASVNHHPDIDIRYNTVKLTLSTHDSGGVTQNDINSAIAANESADAVAA